MKYIVKGNGSIYLLDMEDKVYKEEVFHAPKGTEIEITIKDITNNHADNCQCRSCQCGNEVEK